MAGDQRGEVSVCCFAFCTSLFLNILIFCSPSRRETGRSCASFLQSWNQMISLLQLCSYWRTGFPSLQLSTAPRCGLGYCKQCGLIRWVKISQLPSRKVSSHQHSIFDGVTFFPIQIVNKFRNKWKKGRKRGRNNLQMCWRILWPPGTEGGRDRISQRAREAPAM